MAFVFAFPRRLLLTLIVLLTAGLAAAIVLLQLPRAVITIRPAVEQRAAMQDIVLSEAIQDPDFVRFRLPARVVEGEAVHEQMIERSGAAHHDDFARGSVTLHNTLSEPQELLPKTHLRHESSGIFFLTDQPVAIPAGGEVAMTVTAKERGGAGNVPAGKFIVDRLPAETQSAVFGVSDAPMAGGVAVDEPLSEKEVTAAREAAVQAAREEAQAKVSAAAGGAAIREDLMHFEETEVAVSAEPGSTAASFSVRAVVRGRALLIDDTDLLGLTVLTLRESAGPDEEFVTYDPQSFKATIVRSDFARGEAVVQGTLTGEFARKLSPGVFSGENLAGLSRQEVAERLQALPGVGSVTVDFWPFWVQTVPSRPERVNISVASDKTSP